MTQITVLFFFQQIARTVDEFFEWDSSKLFRRLTIFSERIARTVQTDANVFEWIARAVQTDANFFERIARTFRTADDFFFEWIAQAVRTDANFLEWIARAVRTVSLPLRTANEQLTNGYPFKNG